MSRLTRQPIALTIAGSDSGGGAGIQADLHTFAALGVHGACAITCLTAQNPRGVRGIQAASPALLRQQIEAVFAELPPAAVKTGMLYDAKLIAVVVEVFRQVPRPPLVVDPVMVATSGARLLKAAAITAVHRDLLPLAALVTPNVDETALLVGRPVKSLADLRQAARELHERHGCATLVKGGHLRRLPKAVDVYFDGRSELLLEAPRIRNVSTHGTGCTYSAAIAALLAKGLGMADAVTGAKQFITAAIAASRVAAGHPVLGWAAAGRRV